MKREWENDFSNNFFIYLSTSHRFFLFPFTGVLGFTRSLDEILNFNSSRGQC